MKNKMFTLIGRIISIITVMVIPTGIGYICEEFADLDDATVVFTAVWVGVITIIGLLKALKGCLTK